MLKIILGATVLALLLVLVHCSHLARQLLNRLRLGIAPQGAQTRVTWLMSGPMPCLSKLMTTFVSMDRMVGGDFEAGLQNLKVLAEAR